MSWDFWRLRFVGFFFFACHLSEQKNELKTDSDVDCRQYWYQPQKISLVIVYRTTTMSNEYTSRILVNDGDFLGKLLFPSSVATHFYRIYTRTYNIDPNLLFLVKKHYLRTVNHTYQFPFSFLFFIFVVSFCLFFIRAINFLFGSLRLIEEQNQRWNLFHEKMRGGIEIWKTRRNGLSFGVISLLWLWYYYWH